MEVEIVQRGKVTNDALWIQLKATDSKRPKGRLLSFSAKTKHLKYWQGCSLPVIVLYYVKPQDTFYYLFAQEYIRETLSPENPNWRRQKTATIRFSTKLEGIRALSSIALSGRLYIAQQQLGLQPGGAHYWLDGIPTSDNDELKERTARALEYAAQERYPEAIAEFEEILRVCTVSPTERMSLLLSLGNAYYGLSQLDLALRNYEALLRSATKVDEQEALRGKANALSGIGLVSSNKGELDEALKYLKDALKIHREIGYKQGEANQLGNIGLIYSDKGELDEALKYLKRALRILDDFKFMYGRDIIENAIAAIKGKK